MGENGGIDQKWQLLCTHTCSVLMSQSALLTVRLDSRFCKEDIPASFDKEMVAAADNICTALIPRYALSGVIVFFILMQRPLKSCYD